MDDTTQEQLFELKNQIAMLELQLESMRCRMQPFNGFARVMEQLQNGELTVEDIKTAYRLSQDGAEEILPSLDHAREHVHQVQDARGFVL
ncbi:TPA: hypothetical protein HA361_06970 [Candidatus Woesearchaeota archaeon]|nr:hypothetical protein [Candidatus Woesearchaeota archaeon]HII68257.1 hypothetical protein [Candidatus Woesearchaeota archaeon]